jgi:hypothetical protein
MRKNCSWISELALVTVVSSLVMLMFPLGSIASQGDWVIYHNEEYVPNGGTCHVIASDGVNHVEGTFEWGYSGVTFLYTYDPYTAWYSAPASYQSGYYVFDFDTDWDHEYGDQFRIRPSIGSQYDYYCTLDI